MRQSHILPGSGPKNETKNTFLAGGGWLAAYAGRSACRLPTTCGTGQTADHRDLVTSVRGLGRQFVEYILCMAKSATLAWELMFTRSSFGTEDMAEQHRILDRVADLVDAGRIRSTLTKTLEGFTAENHRLAGGAVERPLSKWPRL